MTARLWRGPKGRKQGSHGGVAMLLPSFRGGPSLGQRAAPYCEPYSGLGLVAVGEFLHFKCDFPHGVLERLGP